MHKRGIVRATLRRTSDGAVKEVVDEGWGEDGAEAAEFCWTEGNYSCDCNRAIFFGDGEEPDSDACGETRYRLLSLSVDGEDMEMDPES